MHIVVCHPRAVSDYDRRNVEVWCDPDECETWDAEDHKYNTLYRYIDTHFGTFRRSVNYWWPSPYGWEAVGWG